MIKDDAELELLRISSRINDKCMSYLVSEISGDLSEKELSENCLTIMLPSVKGKQAEAPSYPTESMR